MLVCINRAQFSSPVPSLPSYTIWYQVLRGISLSDMPFQYIFMRLVYLFDWYTMQISGFPSADQWYGTRCNDDMSKSRNRAFLHTYTGSPVVDKELLTLLEQLSVKAMLYIFGHSFGSAFPPGSSCSCHHLDRSFPRHYNLHREYQGTCLRVCNDGRLLVFDRE